MAALLLLLAIMLLCTQPAIAADSASAAAASASVPAASAATTAADVDEVEVDVESEHPVELPPAGAARAAADKGKVLNEEPIALARADFCKACYTVVEEFHKWTVQNFNNPDGECGGTDTRRCCCSRATGQMRCSLCPSLCRCCCHCLRAARRNTTMTRGQLVEWFCRTGPFEHWKENLVWGCIVRTHMTERCRLLAVAVAAAATVADPGH